MLSEKQETLLKIAATENNGRVTVGLAKNLYSSKSAGKSAVTSLQSMGFLDRINAGTWRIVKLPPRIKEELSS